MLGTKKEKWLGGYVRDGKRGPVFVIERWIGGVHYHVSTKCRTERAALKELERWEQDPAGYRSARTQKTSGLVVTPELVDEYVRWMKSRKLSAGYVREHDHYLGEFMVAMAGRDLRRIGFGALREVIDGFGEVAKWNRTKAVKAFASWLRRHKGVLPRAEDPTLDLVNLVQVPEKRRRRKAMAIDIVELAISKMEPKFADIATLMAATGMHLSELIRFHGGEGGLFEPAEWQTSEGVLANMVVLHKGGENHVVALTEQRVVDTARRILAWKEFPSRGAVSWNDEKVSEAIGIKFSMGWLRHSVATWLALKRVSEQEIANLLGHKSTKMVRQVYVDLGLSARPVPIPRLRLVEG